MMTMARRTRFLVAGGVALVLLLAALFRGPLLEPLIALALRRTLRVHTTIAQVGGSVLGSLELHGVNARGEAGSGPLTALEARSISATYSLAALLHGKEAFLDSLDVTVEGARLDLDLTGPPAAAAKPVEQPASRPTLPRMPRFTVRDSRVRVRGQGYALDADGLQGAMARADGAGVQAVDVRVDRFSLRHPALHEGTVSLAITGHAAPRRLQITAARVNGEPLIELASLDLGERPGELDLRAALRLWQGSIEIGMNRRPDGTEVRWDARGVDLQPQILFTNDSLGALRGQLSTSGAVRLGGGGISTLTGKLSLDWQGAQLAGRTVDHLVIQGSAEPGTVRVETAEGRIGPNEIQLHQVALPAAPLFEGRWRALLAAASGSFDGTFGDVPAFLALWGVGTGAGGATVPDHRLRLEGSLEQGTIRLARGDLAAGPGKAALEALVVTFPREDQGWGETAFSGAATVDLPNLRDLSALFPGPALNGSVRGAISGTGTFARPEGRASLTGRGIVVAGKKLGDVDLRAHGAAGEIEVDTFELVQGGNRFTAKGVRFAPAALAAPDHSAFFDSIAGSFALSTTDIPGLAALAGLPPEQVARIPAAHLLTAAGTVKDRAIEVAAASFAAAGGSITLHRARVALPGPGADWAKDTTFEGDLAVDIPDLGSIAAIFHLPQLRGTLTGKARISGRAGAPSGSVEASGRGIAIGGRHVGDVVLKASTRQQQLIIETLEVGRGEDRLRGRGAYDLEKGTILEAEADLSVADVAPYLAEFVREGIPVSGRLHAGLRAGPLPGAPLAFEAEFFDGRVWDAQGVQGRVQAHIELQDPLRQFRVGAASLMTEVHGDVGGRDIQSTLDASYAPGLLRIGAFEITGSGALAVRVEGTMPLDLAADDILSPGPISIRAQASIPALEELASLIPPAFAPTGSLRADAAVTGSWQEPDACLEIRGERLQLPAGTRFMPPGLSTLAGTLAWNRTEARAEKVRLESPSLSLSLSGIWSSPPDLPSLLAGSGAAKMGSLALRATFSSPDIGWLQKSVEGLRGLRGSVAGEIAVDGPAGDPVVSGEIRIAEGAVRYQDLPPLESLAAKASVAGRILTLGSVSGNVGGSPFTLAGSVDFSRRDDPTLNLRLQGKDALLYRDEGLRLRADSDLTLSGPVSALVLSGEVALTNSLYQKTFSVLNLFSGGEKSSKRTAPGTTAISFPEPPLRDMRFDVHLTSRQPFKIKTSVVRGDARPDLRLTGTGLLPILRGPILVDNAQVFLPSGTLAVERGSVLFGEKDPGRPVLDFGGRMEISGYEITAQIGGTFDSPEVVLASNPPLLQEELLLFVLTGAPPASASTNGGSASAVATPMAVYLGKGVIDSLLGGGGPSKGSDLAGRLELQIGRETTNSGSATIDARLRLKKNFLAKGDTLYLTSEKDIYDQENLGLKIVFKFK